MLVSQKTLEIEFLWNDDFKTNNPYNEQKINL